MIDNCGRNQMNGWIASQQNSMITISRLKRSGIYDQKNNSNQIRGFTNWSIYGDSVATPPKMFLSPVKSALEYKDFMGIENPVIEKDLSDLNPALRKRNRSFVLEEKLYFACNQNVLRMGKKKLTTVIEGTEGSIEFIDTNGGFILVGWSYEDTPGCYICAFDKELQRVGGLKTEPDLVSFVALEERALFLNSEGEVRCWNYDDTQSKRLVSAACLLKTGSEKGFFSSKSGQVTGQAFLRNKF